MQRKPYKKIFKNSLETLQEMLTRYQNGETAEALARWYDVHHSAILYQVKLHGIQRTIKEPLVPQGEKINPGKTYKEYIEEDKLRKEKNEATRTSS